jgi:DnaK suppressor protein
MLDDVKVRIRERLENELDDVGRRLEALRDHGLSQETEAMGDNTPLSEAADAAQVTEEREKELQVLDWLVRRSEDLNRALGRLDAETYGICESCGNPIPPKRLLARPEAVLCLECQSESDRRHGIPSAPAPGPGAHPLG